MSRFAVASVTAARAPLYDALCRVGDAMGVRWRREGDFLLGRSTTAILGNGWEVFVVLVDNLQETPACSCTMPECASSAFSA